MHAPSATDGRDLLPSYRELAALAAQLSAWDGDERLLEEFLERRAALLERVRAASGAPVRERAAILQGMAALDREILARLEGYRAQIRRDLAGIAQGRRCLERYGDVVRGGGIAVERLG
jgi:hypothetical protein